VGARTRARKIAASQRRRKLKLPLAAARVAQLLPPFGKFDHTPIALILFHGAVAT
jgi:hypothetical protein